MTMEPPGTPTEQTQGQPVQPKKVNSTAANGQTSPPRLPNLSQDCQSRNHNNNKVASSPSHSRGQLTDCSSQGHGGNAITKQPSPSQHRQQLHVALSGTPQRRATSSGHRSSRPSSTHEHGSIHELHNGHRRKHSSVPTDISRVHRPHEPHSLYSSGPLRIQRSNTIPQSSQVHVSHQVKANGDLHGRGHHHGSSSSDDRRHLSHPSPLPKQKSPHSSPSLSLKNHHRSNSKRSHSSRSDSSYSSYSSEDEKCLPQMESIIRQMASGKVTTDSLVSNFGGCGPFQFLLVMATYSAQIAAVWGMMFMAFGNYHPKWWCYDAADAAAAASMVAVGKNITPIVTVAKTAIESSLSVNLSSASDSGSGGMGEDGRVLGGGSSGFINPAAGGVWIAPPSDPRRANQSGTCSVYKKCQHVEFDSMTSTAASQWGLICDQEWAQSAIISLQMTGVLVGACLGGFIGDRRGRRITLYGHLFFLAVFNVLAIFSPTWQVFAFFRFLIGACVGAILACCILYPVEFVNVWWRGILGALPVWNVGAASFSIAVWLLKDWKQIHIATAVVSLLIFLPVFWVPESMRWLAVNGRVDDAKLIANKIASMNHRPPPNTTVLEIIAKEERRMSRLKGTYSKYTVLDLFADRFIRRISYRMGFVWCAMSACYYALSFGIKNFSGDFYMNFILFSAAEVPGMLFVAPAANKLGRRLGSVVYFLSCTVLCGAVVVASFAASGALRGTIITVLAMLAKMHILAVWMMVTVYSTELYPTVIRNLSTGYLHACGRVGGIAAPFLLPNSPDFLFVAFIIMGILMVISCYLVKTLPETKERPLEDTIKARSHLSIIVEETELEVRVSESA